MADADKGERFRNATGEPNYLSKEGPFPANPAFKSENVLSENAREEIWRRVVKQGEAIKAVSANFGVDMRRVAAVVRLKEVEKAWQREVSHTHFLLVLPTTTSAVFLGTGFK